MKVLYIDIETAPALAYIWDLKTRYVPITQVSEDGYIMCFAAGWEGSDELEFWSIWEDGHDAMIDRAWWMIDEADVVVHYNGTKFDMPRLNTEFLRRRLGPPSPYHQVDLYTTVSSNFKVLSRSMNHILEILELDSKIKHKGMELWTGCMHGEAEDQQIMQDYNLRDVEALEELYKDLLPWIRNHPNRGLWMEEGTDPICPSCGSTHLRFKGYKRTRVLQYKQYQCKDCKTYSRARYASEPKRRKDILT